MKWVFIILFLASTAKGFEFSVEADFKGATTPYEVTIGIEGFEPRLHRVAFQKRPWKGPFQSVDLQPDPPFFREQNVPAGSRWEYRLLIYPQNSNIVLAEKTLKISIPPDYKVISQEHPLEQDANIIAGRTLLPNRNTWVTGNHQVFLRTLHLYTSHSVISSFLGREGDGQIGEAGQSLKKISLLAHRASGILRLDFRGGNGGPGRKGENGNVGAKGKDGEAGMAVAGICHRQPTNGWPGANGKPGKQGGRGGSGGNVDWIHFFVAYPSDFSLFPPTLTAGVGGPGGEGGNGGAGGPGGNPGSRPLPCASARPGPQGSPGPNGPPGHRGKDGQMEKICLWVGTEREGNCAY